MRYDLSQGLIWILLSCTADREFLRAGDGLGLPSIQEETGSEDCMSPEEGGRMAQVTPSRQITPAIRRRSHAPSTASAKAGCAPPASPVGLLDMMNCVPPMEDLSCVCCAHPAIKAQTQPCHLRALSQACAQAALLQCHHTPQARMSSSQHCWHA